MTYRFLISKHFLLNTYNIIIIFLLSSCQKQSINVGTLANENKNIYGLTVDAAKKYFAIKESENQGIGLSISDMSYFTNVHPDWSNAKQKEDENYWVVECPIQLEKFFGFSLDGTIKNPDKSKTLLLVLKHRVSHKVGVALMHIIPFNGSSTVGVQYNNRSVYFSGFVFYTTIDGIFLNGWEYEKGKVVKARKKLVRHSYLQIAPLENEECQESTINTYRRFCVNYSDGSQECGPWILTNTVLTNNCSSNGSGGLSGDTFETTVYQINNNIQDSCLKAMVDDAISGNIRLSIMGLLNQVFQLNVDLDLSFYEKSFSDSTDGETSIVQHQPPYMHVRIKLDNVHLPNASKEYVLATILHESMHAVLASMGLFTHLRDDHQLLGAFVREMQSNLVSYFPTLSSMDALDLAWGGMQGSGPLYWGTLSGNDLSRIAATNSNYKFNSANYGTKCK